MGLPKEFCAGFSAGRTGVLGLCPSALHSPKALRGSLTMSIAFSSRHPRP